MKYKIYTALYILIQLITAIILMASSIYILNMKPHHMAFNFRVGLLITVSVLVLSRIVKGVFALRSYTDGTTNNTMRAKKKRKSKNEVIQTLREFNKVLLVGLCAFSLVGYSRANVVDLVRSASGSMEPTVNKGDYVLVNKLSEINRFDIIMFKSPDKRYQHFLKRIVGLPGDTIEFRNDRLVLNGRELTEDYLVRPSHLKGLELFTKNYKVSSIHGSNLVPDGMAFVMGDSRRGSRDSRIIGFVPIDNIVGRAVAVRSKDEPWYEKDSWGILEDIDIYGKNIQTKEQYDIKKGRLRAPEKQQGNTDEVLGRQ